MNTLYAKLVCLIVLGSALVSCGKKEEQPPKPEPSETSTAPPAFSGASFMPGSIETYGIALADSIEIVLPTGARDALGDQAQNYAASHFVGLATATYHVGDIPVYAKIEQFSSMEDAYGFYSRARPNGIAIGTLGAESYTLDNALYFMVGEYMVTVSVEREQEDHFSARSLIAQEINSRIPQTGVPDFFMLFPSKDKVSPSTKYVSTDFLDIPELDRVYTTAYVANGDSALFFLTVDSGGEQFLRFRGYAQSIGKVTTAPEAFLYYEGYSADFEHAKYGRIVAGLVRGKLVGIVGYKAESHQRLGTLWIRGLL